MDYTPPRIPERLNLYAGDDTSVPLDFSTDDGTPLDLTEWDDWRATWHTGEHHIPLTITVSATTVTVTFTAAQTRQAAGTYGALDIQAVRAGLTRTFVRADTGVTVDVTQ